MCRAVPENGRGSGCRNTRGRSLERRVRRVVDSSPAHTNLAEAELRGRFTMVSQKETRPRRFGLGGELSGRRWFVMWMRSESLGAEDLRRLQVRHANYKVQLSLAQKLWQAEKQYGRFSCPRDMQYRPFDNVLVGKTGNTRRGVVLTKLAVKPSVQKEVGKLGSFFA